MAIDTNKVQQQAAELSSQLWSICNDLRGGMDANEFRNYILGTIFYRYLSERTEMYMQDILKEDNLSYEEAFTNPDFRPIVEKWSIEHLGYIIRPENLFRVLYQRIVRPKNDRDKFSVEDYERAVSELTGSTLGQKSEKAFEGLFNDMRLQDTRLGDTVSERTDKISKVIAKIGDIDMDLQDQQFDVLGTAYMILIGLFQSGAGKKGGEFFTPVGPSTLCATLASIGLDEAKTVGDCTCGSASMLLDIRKHLTTGKIGHYYGQENNPTTYNLARMNMLMHGIDYQQFDINKGDTLINDTYGDELKLTVQVCNPPYSLRWDANPKYLDDPRYSGVGKLAPKGHADFAFLQHMVYHMDEQDGRVAVLLPHGVLFRGDAEEDIRKYLIKDLNRVDAVIGLPANLFHGTPIPVVILVLKSNRNGNKNNILFIDASREFTKGKKQNTLEDVHIQKIVDAYKRRENIPHFSYVASLDEVAANDYKLNILAYVKLDQVDSKTDILSASEALISVQERQKEADVHLMEYAHMLGIDDFTPETIEKIIHGRLRFKKSDGSCYQDWKTVKLGDVLTERKEKSNGKLRICSVALKGVVDQIEHLGRSYAAADTSNYGRVEYGDVIYTKSPTGLFPFGIVKQSQIKEAVAVSPLYGIFIPMNYYLGKLLHYYFESPANTNNYLAPIIQKGAKNTINISNDTFLSATLSLPMDEEEQQKIVEFISAFDDKIQADIAIANAWSEIKGGLLNNMFSTPVALS